MVFFLKLKLHLQPKVIKSWRFLICVHSIKNRIISRVIRSQVFAAIDLNTAHIFDLFGTKMSNKVDGHRPKVFAHLSSDVKGQQRRQKAFFREKM